MELLRRLNAIPRLPLDEELALIRRAQAGDGCARARVLAANLRVTCMVVLRYRPRLAGRIDDAIAHGTEGLIEALASFDPDRRVRFATYAYQWVRRSVVRRLFFRDAVVRRPESLLRTGAAITVGDVSLDAPVHHDDGRTGLDLLASDAPSPEDLAGETSEQSARAKKLDALGFHRLDQRSRFILAEMIMADEPRTAREVATRLGLSRQRIQQLRDRALSALAGASPLHGAPSDARP